MTENIYLSIIIPAYNEEKRIGRTLSVIDEFIRVSSYGIEVIVVDDGSSDGTRETVLSSALARYGKLKLIDNGVNKGKGFSVRNGISHSSGEFVLFSDADMSTPVSEVSRLLHIAGEGYDMVIGSRALKDSRIEAHQPWYREIMGKVFNCLVRMFVVRGIRDTQCGFKLINGETAREIASEMKIDGFCFDVEMIAIAKGKGIRIMETGVIWVNSPESRVRIFDSSFKMFLDLFRIMGRRA